MSEENNKSIKEVLTSSNDTEKIKILMGIYDLIKKNDNNLQRIISYGYLIIFKKLIESPNTKIVEIVLCCLEEMCSCKVVY